ncbi:MAG: chromate transporter [Synergistaceae bacterium]|nr:chromate transporter [Synergistaceae bacterium]
MSGMAELLASFFKVVLFSVGGGYAVIPMIQQEIVERRGWITARVFADIITISQMTPGPLAVNASTFVGVQAAGIAGALTATAGCTVSGVVISALLYSFLIKNRASTLTAGLLGPLKAASAGLILSAAATITLSTLAARTASGAATIDKAAFVLFAASLLAARRYKINPVMIIAAAGLAGLIIN